jgi:hypothetical protein
MKRTDIQAAAKLWFSHRGWSVPSIEKVGGTDTGVHAIDVVISKMTGELADRRRVLVIQHRAWFDPLDFVDDHFRIPKNDLTTNHYLVRAPSTETENRIVLVWNSSRTYCVFLDALMWNFFHVSDSESGVFCHKDDLNCAAVPWRLWALDAIPEWLHRGWPNPVPGKSGRVGDPDSWQWHPHWCEDVLHAAEGYTRLPCAPDEAPNFLDWRAKRWYREWLEHHDDAILPWSA